MTYAKFVYLLSLAEPSREPSERLRGSISIYPSELNYTKGVNREPVEKRGVDPDDSRPRTERLVEVGVLARAFSPLVSFGLATWGFLPQRASSPGTPFAPGYVSAGLQLAALLAQRRRKFFSNL